MGGFVMLKNAAGQCIVGVGEAREHPLSWRRRLEAKSMKKLVLILILVATPAGAQTRLVPKGAEARADNCAPIGRTASGELVYSMKCESIPAPPAPPQAEAKEAPASQPETQRGGLFGWSYDRRSDQ
jgi:hypothetical protein